jgi:hypothetical protein
MTTHALIAGSLCEKEALPPAVRGSVEPNANVPALNVEALGPKENAGAVECRPD